jgi:hypothetical protein
VNDLGGRRHVAIVLAPVGPLDAWTISAAASRQERSQSPDGRSSTTAALLDQRAARTSTRPPLIRAS